MSARVRRRRAIWLLAVSAIAATMLVVPIGAAHADCYVTRVPAASQKTNADVGGRGNIGASVQTPATKLEEVCTGDEGYTEGWAGGAEAPGGGEGGEARCDVSPMGPAAQVRRVVGAVNAERTPNVKNPSVERNDGGRSKMDQTQSYSWFRMQGANAQVLHLVICPDGTVEQQWLNVRAAVTATGDVVVIPQVRAIDLVPGLHAEVTRRLPTPTPRIAPADNNPNGWTYVQYATYFWVDEAAGQWGPVTATATAGSVSVTVRADPVRFVVDPGDGTEPITCEGAPPEVTAANYEQLADTACSHHYRHSSSVAPNGETYPVTVGIAWDVSWSANTGQGANLGSVVTTSPTRWLAVAERQAIIVDTHSDG